MLTRRHCLGIYVSCNGKCSAIYRSILLHNDSLWISAIIFLILLLITEGKTSLRLEKNTFSILLRDSRFRGVWFSRFLRTTTCRTFRSNPCGYDSIPYATDCLITAMDNEKSPPTKLYIPLYVRCITWCYACHFKRKY